MDRLHRSWQPSPVGSTERCQDSFLLVERGVATLILTHLGEPLEPPHVSPARGPPVDWGELVQSQGAGEFEQASPDDLPMIDIHHR